MVMTGRFGLLPLLWWALRAAGGGAHVDDSIGCHPWHQHRWISVLIVVRRGKYKLPGVRRNARQWFWSFFVEVTPASMVNLHCQVWWWIKLRFMCQICQLLEDDFFFSPACSTDLAGSKLEFREFEICRSSESWRTLANHVNIRVHTTPGDSNLTPEVSFEQFFKWVESCQVLAAGVSCDDRGLIVPDSLGRVS